MILIKNDKSKTIFEVIYLQKIIQVWIPQMFDSIPKNPF